MGRLKHDQGQFFYSFRLNEAVPGDHPIQARSLLLCRFCTTCWTRLARPPWVRQSWTRTSSQLFPRPLMGSRSPLMRLFGSSKLSCPAAGGSVVIVLCLTMPPSKFRALGLDPIFEPGQNRCDCLLTPRWGTYSTKVSTLIAGAVRYHSPCSRCSFRPNLHWLNWKHRVLRDQRPLFLGQGGVEVKHRARA